MKGHASVAGHDSDATVGAFLTKSAEELIEKLSSIDGPLIDFLLSIMQADLSKTEWSRQRLTDNRDGASIER